MDFEIFDDDDSLAADVATKLLARIAVIQKAEETPQIVLTGGGIADKIHRALARRADDGSVDWADIEFWWGDERFVPEDSDERNAKQARQALLDHVAVNQDLVHEIAADDGIDIDAAALHYGEKIRRHPAEGFDIVMLGIGPDGHIASLFPGFEQLHVTDDLVVSVDESPKPPPRRITLTYPALSQAKEVWFVAAGESKADAIAQAVTGADFQKIPAAGVRGSSRTIWYLDTKAASRLRR